MDRRTVLTGALAGAAGVVLSGCHLFIGDPPPPHPLLASHRETRALLNRYEAVISQHPALAERLGPLRDNHRAHLSELAKLIGPAASESPAPAASQAVPPDEKTALRELRDAERAGQDAASLACLNAKRQYAGLLGSIAASRATHQEALK